jgi:hypothetical protein
MRSRLLAPTVPAAGARHGRGAAERLRAERLPAERLLAERLLAERAAPSGASSNETYREHARRLARAIDQQGGA